MKILKSGRIPNPNIHTCSFCECEFEINEKKDIQTEQKATREYDCFLAMNEWQVVSEIQYCFCPTCKKKIILEVKELTRDLIPFHESLNSYLS